MTDFIIEDLLDDRYSFTAPDAIERSTGWKDSYCVKFPDGEVEFFDAEANELFPCSPIRDLAVAISWFEDELADERDDDWDPADDCPVPLTFANTGCRRF